MAMIERVNPGRRGFSPGVVRVNVKTTLHPITHRAVCVAAVEQNRPFPLILDDALAEYFDIPIDERGPDRPGDGTGDSRRLGSVPRSELGIQDPPSELPKRGPSAS
jgi:hypothetical protein